MPHSPQRSQGCNSFEILPHKMTSESPNNRERIHKLFVTLNWDIDIVTLRTTFMIDLSEQHLLISGGDLSLIRGIASQLQIGGATITILHHDESVTTLADELNCKSILADWDSLETISDTLKTIETINGVIICPTEQPIGRFIDSTAKQWDHAMKVNYESAVYISQAVAKHMIANETKGSIVFLSPVSTAMPFVDSSLTGTSLATLRPLAKMAAVDCGQYGIRTHTLVMGWVESESTQAHLTPKGREYIENGISLGYVADATAIGDVCCFLMSDLSRYMTGSVITVDGGYTLTRTEGQSPFPMNS